MTSQARSSGKNRVLKSLRKASKRVPRLRSTVLYTLGHLRRLAKRGHLLELYTDAHYGVRVLTNGATSTQSKFAVYGQGRSGSSLLLNLIESHPDVFNDGEVFNRNKASRLLMPAKYLQARAALSPKPIYGAKLKIYEMTDDQGIEDPRQFLKNMHDSGWKFIHLERRDLFKKALSLVIAQARWQFAVTASSGSADVDQLRVDPRRLIETMHERQQADRAEALALRDIPHLKVVYEDDLLDNTRHQPVCDKVFEFIGVEPVAVSTKYVRTSRRKVSEYVLNYDEIVEEVGRTEFRAFLPSEPNP